MRRIVMLHGTTTAVEFTLDHMGRVHHEMPSLQHVGQLLLERAEPLRQKQSLSTLRQEDQTCGWASTRSFVVCSCSRRFSGAKPVARQRGKRRSHRPIATTVLPTAASGLAVPSRRTASPPLNSSVRPRNLILMFETTVTLFDEYYRKQDAVSDPGFNRNLGCEVRKRLQQLDFIIDKVRRLESDAAEPLARFKKECEEHARIAHEYEGRSDAPELPPLTKITKEEFAAHSSAQFEMELLTESFYYLACRIRTIIKSKERPLPALNSFECTGVRDTRHKLLEHPEGKDSRVHMLSFGWGKPRGPVIKAIRWSDQEEIFPDKGLYENAEEFRSNLNAVLQNALGGA